MNPTRRGSESEGSNPASSALPTPTLRDNRPLPPTLDSIRVPVSSGAGTSDEQAPAQQSGLGKGRPVVSQRWLGWNMNVHTSR